MRKLLALVVGLAIVGSPSIAEAKSAKSKVADTGVTVMVENHLPKSYPVQKALDFVDQYTGSHFVLGSCVVGTQCIIMTMSSTLGKNVNAFTYWYTPLESPRNGTASHPFTTLQMATSMNKRSSSDKMIVLVHELGHARDLDHAPKCTTVMYGFLNCGKGKKEPLVFSTAEQRLLAVA